MRIITAPEPYKIYNKDEPTLFLAGGITNCPDWQKEIIEYLKDDDVTIFNPRRDNFSINDPNESYNQIMWEYKAIQTASIFSMWFCNSKSDQPICMYELGKELQRRNEYRSMRKNIVIGIEKGYRRENDVRIQSKLVIDEITIVDDFDDYLERIQYLIQTWNV